MSEVWNVIFMKRCLGDFMYYEDWRPVETNVVLYMYNLNYWMKNFQVTEWKLEPVPVT